MRVWTAHRRRAYASPPMSATLPEVHGECHPRFQAVRDAFARNLRDRDEVGAAVAVVVDGEPVVDLWGGHADLARTQPWERNTLVNVYSCTKGMTALCAHRLVRRVGSISMRRSPGTGRSSRRPARPSCRCAGCLGHRAGLAAVRKLLPNEALYDWDAMCAALAAETPWWKPGTAHGYHAVTFGWLVGEVVRRITGKSLGTYFREEVAGAARRSTSTSGCRSASTVASRR